MLASRPRGALYIGVTNALERRVWEHRSGVGSEHVGKYRIFRLVWAEPFDSIVEAIAAEKRIKRWRRAWKDQLIERDNPHWLDLLPAD
jgi:putative endonuclease